MKEKTKIIIDGDFSTSTDFFALPKAEKLKRLAFFGSLAPSGHNAQPWLFHFVENGIQVLPNMSRTLDSDPSFRQLHLSLGAAVGNIILAAEGFGLTCQKQLSKDNTGHLITTVTFSNLENSGPEKPEILNAIKGRHNNRSNFSSQRLPENFLAQAKDLATPGTSLFFISDPEVKKQIQSVVSASTVEAFGDKKFVRELASWMHPGLKKYRDGFVGYNLGMPLLLSFIFPYMLKYLPMAKPQEKMTNVMLNHAPTFALLASENDAPEEWLKTGEIFENIAVLAQKEGIKIGVLGAPTEIGEHYKQLQSILKTGSRPEIFFRLGYSDFVPQKSPRLPLEQLIT